MADAYRIGEFVLESKLGEGGMGVVFRARQVGLDRWVALKLLSRPAAAGSTYIERFNREARAAAQLIHPNIIQIYTIGDHKGTPFFAMEYVEGRDLASLLRSGEPLTIDEAIEVTRSVAKALATASERGIVHRDIKPGNIMIARSGLVKVMDFGLAKATTTDQSLTHDGQIMGTPTYMSPEQGMSKEVDTRSDLYALGCVLFECLTGRPPYQADNVAALIFKHLYEPIESPKKSNPLVPEALEAICVKLLAKKPEDRYADGSALLESLAALPTNSSLAELALAKRSKAQPPEPPAPLGEEEAAGDAAVKDETVTPTSVTLPKPPSKKRSAKPSAHLPTMVQPPPEGAEAPAAKATQPLAKKKSPTAHLPTIVQQAEAPEEDPSRPPSGIHTPAHGIRRISARAPFSDEPMSVPPAPAKSGSRLSVPPPAKSGSRLSVPPPPKPVTGRIVVPPPTAPTEKPVSGRFVVPPPTPFPASSEKPVTPPPRTPLLGTPARMGSRLLASKAVATYFKRLTDGRWTYDATQGHCRHAEGLATESLPGADLQVGTLGDCLVCANWGRRSGCAIAATQYISNTSRARGADLIEEQAAVWCQAGRFEMAIGMLEEYIQAHPEDPGGYRALARLYERPDYTGKERSRAIILYNQFVELAAQNPNYTSVEVHRAQERLEALKGGRASGIADAARPASGMYPNVLHTFRCFHRLDNTAYFAFGALSRERLVLARAGEVDPDSGISAADMGNPLQRATGIFRRFKGEKSKLEEREEVRREVARLEKTPLEALARESGKSLSVPMASVEKVEYSVDLATDIRTLRVRAQAQAHELIFPPQTGPDGERCAVMVRRLSGK